jgi:hypothetical protein
VSFLLPVSKFLCTFFFLSGVGMLVLAEHLSVFQFLLGRFSTYFLQIHTRSNGEVVILLVLNFPEK